MQDISRNPTVSQVLLEVKSKENIRRLGLRISNNAIIPIIRRPRKRGRKRLEMVLLGRDLLALEVIVAEPDRRQSMSRTSEVDDAGRAGCCVLGRLLKERQEQIRKQEGPDVVRAKLPFYPLGRLVARVYDARGVVDEDVKRVCHLGDLGSCVPDRSLGGEVELDDLDFCVGVGGLDLLDDGFDLGACSGCQD